MIAVITCTPQIFDLRDEQLEAAEAKSSQQVGGVVFYLRVYISSCVLYIPPNPSIGSY